MLALFDIDGTLLDEAAAQRVGVAALHTAAKASCSLEEFAASWSAALDRHFARYLRGEIDFQEQRRARIRDMLDSRLSDGAADDWCAVYLEAYESAWTLFDDVLPCLERLGDCLIGVVSNGAGAQQRAKLKRTALTERFDCIVISEECGLAKPSRQVFLHACQLVGAQPSNAIYVGDSYENDALAARSAGLAGVWLDRCGLRTDEHEPPVIATLAQLGDLTALA